MIFNLKKVDISISKVCLGISALSLVITSILAMGLSSQAQNNQRTIPKFDPNIVVTDGDFTSTRVFGNSDSIQKYLESANSPLKNYRQNNKPASQIIFDASRGNSNSQSGITPQLNPGLMLALLQKEQSLITATDYNTATDPEKKLKYATGYACPDNGPCNEAYAGFENQVKWAAFQLQFNFDYSVKNDSRVSPYIKGQTITTLDNNRVFISNSATAAFYRYTPHVYWGNYNLWKIMTSNGWGESSSTYTFAELDDASLSKKVSNPAAANQTLDSSLLKKNYNIGQSDDSVILLQTFLRQEGYFAHPTITGYYGSVTDQAARNYRLDKKILSTSLSSSCQSVVSGSFNAGLSDERVRQLQLCLSSVGIFDSSLITGYFGSVTSRALEVARTSSGLTAQPTVSAPAVIPVANKCQDLKNGSYKIGDTGQRILDLQQCLKDVGLFNWPGGITGYYGAYTESKLTEWRKGSNTQPSDECATVKTLTYNYGEKGEKVSKLQKCLQKNNLFDHPTITGFLGDITKAGLIKWRGYF